MDGIVVIGAALAAGLAAYYAVRAMQGSFVSTRDVVRARTLGGGIVPASAQPIALEPRRRRLPAALSSEGIELELIRADWPIRVREYVFLRLLFAVLGGFVLMYAVSMLEFGAAFNIIAFIAGFVYGSTLPKQYVGWRTERRLRAIEAALPETLNSMALSLRAGAGLLQALDYAATRAPAPLGPELTRTLRDLQMGGDPQLVFDELNRRVGSHDISIVTTAIMIQRSVGGNLSEVLAHVSETIRERRQIMDEIHTMTSRQRLQGNLVAALPVFVAGFFFLVNPEMANRLIDTQTGRIALAVGIGFELLGLWLIRRLSKIEV